MRHQIEKNYSQNIPAQVELSGALNICLLSQKRLNLWLWFNLQKLVIKAFNVAKVVDCDYKH